MAAPMAMPMMMGSAMEKSMTPVDGQRLQNADGRRGASAARR